MNIILHFLNENLTMIYLLVFASYLGMEIISNVPTVLHTPLMSGANAISGVVVIGAIYLLRQSETNDYFAMILGLLGITLATINVVGGFAVTNRMLEMFNKKKKAKS